MNISSNESVNQRAMVAHDFESTRAEYRTWQEWYEGETRPGCYDTENLNECRLTSLQNNISPTVMYNHGELTSLQVNIYKQHMYKTPRFESYLLQWIEELSHAVYDFPYRGENVAGYTHQVVLSLVKNRRTKKGVQSRAIQDM